MAYERVKPTYLYNPKFQINRRPLFVIFFHLTLPNIFLILFLTLVHDLQDRDFCRNANDASKILYVSYYFRTPRVIGKYLLNNSPVVHRG